MSALTEALVAARKELDEFDKLCGGREVDGRWQDWR